MFNGVNAEIMNRNIGPVCDLGGRRILGMGGSLRGYINTGNQYNKDYFVKSNKRKHSSKKDKKFDFSKLIKPAATLAGLAAGVLAFKKGGSKLFSKLSEKAKNKPPKNTAGIISKVKKFVSGIGEKISEKFKNIKFPKFNAEKANKAPKENKLPAIKRIRKK